MLHVRLINSKTFGVKMVLLCDKTVLIYDKYSGWYVYKKGRTFYVTRKVNGKTVLLHREILGLVEGDGIYGDHINGNGLDNQLTNLRPATQQENNQNVKKCKNNTSGFKGAYLFKRTGKYMSSITHNCKQIHLGYFNTPEEAHEQYCKKGKELFGEFFNAG